MVAEEVTRATSGRLTVCSLVHSEFSPTLLNISARQDLHHSTHGQVGAPSAAAKVIRLHSTRIMFRQREPRQSAALYLMANQAKVWTGEKIVERSIVMVRSIP